MSRPRSIAFDQALEHVNNIGILSTELDRLYRTNAGDRAAIGYAQQHLGQQMKLADVHATLAVAETLAQVLDVVDAMPADLVARSLAAVADLEAAAPSGLPDHEFMPSAHAGLTCHVDGCLKDPVVFPPAACAEHGGLEAATA
jgi:hypothetical protein